MRARWKVNFDFETNRISDNQNVITNNISNPYSVISYNLIGQRVEIYTGKKGFSILIRDYMLGDRIGYYGICKRTGDFHPPHVKKKRRRKKGINKNAKKKINKKKRK